MYRSACPGLCVWWLSQKEPKGSQTDEAREAAVHSRKVLFPQKIAPHLVCVHLPCDCVSAVLPGCSLFLPVNIWNNTRHARLSRQAKPTKGSVGRPIYSAAEGRGRDERTGKRLPQGQINLLFLPPISHHHARLRSQTLIGHSR